MLKTSCGYYSQSLSPYEHLLTNILTVKSLFFPYPLQHPHHTKSSIEHSVMFKGHFIEGVQRQSTSWICVLQCSQGYVQAVGLVAQRRLLSCDHFKCLLNNKNKNISALERNFLIMHFHWQRQSQFFFSDLNRKQNVITCLGNFLWCLA